MCGLHDTAATEGSLFFRNNATDEVGLWDHNAGFFAYNSIPCRCLTIGLYMYAILHLRRDEQNFPKDITDLKRIDEERKMV
jgi:hypothetical protein